MFKVEGGLVCGAGPERRAGASGRWVDRLPASVGLENFGHRCHERWSESHTSGRRERYLPLSSLERADLSPLSMATAAAAMMRPQWSWRSVREALKKSQE